MAAQGAGPGQGSGGPAAEPHPAQSFEPVRDRDVKVELQLPPGRKRQRLGPTWRSGPHTLAAAPTAGRIVTIKAAGQLLKSASPKFCAMLERWSGEGSGGALRLQCGSEQEADTWGDLLDCIHSLGRQLPADVDAVLRLLLLAREQAAEPVVAACLRELHEKADQLPAAACLALLSHLETGVSEHEQLQALGARLLVAACQRTAKLMSEDAAVRSDAAVQAQLLAYLGPLQHMLNNSLRRDLFLGLPFELRRDCLFDDPNINADYEVTVLAAFACWVERNIQELDEQGIEQVTAICSRIRFPDIPAGMLRNYWTNWSFLNQFDPGCDILSRALVAASDPQQVDMWKRYIDDNSDDDEDDGMLTVAQFKAKCASWWQPREPQLAPDDGAAEFAVEVDRSCSPDTEVYSVRKYWGGYWWRIQISKEPEGCAGIFVSPSMSSSGSVPTTNMPKALTYGIQADYRVYVDGSNASWSCEWRAGFLPSKGTGWGFYIKLNDEPVAWDAFWAPDSPWLVNGKARVRFTLEAVE